MIIPPPHRHALPRRQGHVRGQRPARDQNQHEHRRQAGLGSNFPLVGSGGDPLHPGTGAGARPDGNHAQSESTEVASGQDQPPVQVQQGNDGGGGAHTTGTGAVTVTATDPDPDINEKNTLHDSSLIEPSPHSSLGHVTNPTETDRHQQMTKSQDDLHNHDQTHTASTASVAASATDHSLVYPNSFPPGFPVPHITEFSSGDHGREYLFIGTSKLGDSMLIFGAMVCFFAVFSVVLIKCTKLFERRRGNIKVDGMVGDDMRWAEGREVLEKKIIYESVAERRGVGRHLARMSASMGMGIGNGARSRLGDAERTVAMQLRKGQ